MANLGRLAVTWFPRWGEPLVSVQDGTVSSQTLTPVKTISHGRNPQVLLIFHTKVSHIGNAYALFNSCRFCCYIRVRWIDLDETNRPCFSSIVTGPFDMVADGATELARPVADPSAWEEIHGFLKACPGTLSLAEAGSAKPGVRARLSTMGVLPN